MTHLHTMGSCGIKHIYGNVLNTHILTLIAIEVNRLRSS